MINPQAVKSIIDPLCKATSEHFQPPAIFATDYLTVGIDEDGDRFIVEAKNMREYTGVMPVGFSENDLVTHNDKKMLVSRRGPSTNAAVKWLAMVPERKQKENTNIWRIAATDFSVLAIYACWPMEKVIFTSDTAKLLFMGLLARFQSQHINAVRAARFDLEGVVPELPEDFIDHPEFPLLTHQKVPLVNSLFQKGFGLFMEQGTCKTSTCIARVCLESARKRAGKIEGWPQTLYRVLIVCPNAVRHNWQNEFAKFAVVPGKVAIMDGDWETRVRRQLDGTSDEPQYAWGACIIGQDSVEPTLDSLIRSPWDLLIIDESHGVKNHRTNRWQALRTLKRDGKVRQTTILTGTPIANSVMDLWAQLELLDRGMSGFLFYKNFTAFHGKYVHLDNLGVGSAIEKLVGIKHIPLIQERLSRCTYRITKERAGLSLPDKVYDIVEVEMTDEQTRIYNTLKDQLAIEIRDLLSSENRSVRADHVLTKLLRLAQITSGHIVFEEETDADGAVVRPYTVQSINGKNPKLDATIDLLKAEGRDPRGKTIVWATFRHDIAVIKARLDEEGIPSVVYHGDVSESDRFKAVEQFNTNPAVKVFVANAQTAGAGLNLLGYDPANPDRFDTYCDHEIFYSQNWSSVLRSQAEDRAHRKGTRTNVRITDLVVPDTVDEDIRKEVTKKQQDAAAIQDIKDILRSVLGIQ